MKIILNFLLALIPAMGISQSSIRAYAVGDTVKDELLTELINKASLSQDLGSVKNKLLIVDFFATSCKGCIEALPHINTVREEHATEMEVIAITYEKKDRVERFTRQNKIGKEIQVDYISDDTTLKAYFPHQSISHLVWIYKGIVKAITYSDYVNEENVSKVLAGKNLHLPVKREIPDYDYTKGLLIVNDINIPTFSMPKTVYYSAVTGYLNSVYPSVNMTIDSVRKIAHYSFINRTIPQLYFAAADLQPFAKSQVIAVVSDTSRYFYDPKPAYRELWDSTNRYCYDAFMPTSMTLDEMRSKMWRDLDDYFGLETKIERKKVDCLSVEVPENPSLRKAKQVKAVDPNKIVFLTVMDLVAILNKEHLGTPFIFRGDNGLFGPVYLTTINDMAIVEAELLSQGILLKRKKQEMDMFFIKEKGKDMHKTP